MNAATERARQRRAQGRCTNCGCDITALVDWSGARCPECRERRNAAVQQYRNSAKGRAQARKAAARYFARNQEKVRDRMRALYERRKLQGVCVTCAVPWTDSNKCPTCSAEEAAAKRRYYQSRRQRFDEAGLCTHCGGQRDRDGKWCTACHGYLKTVKQRIKEAA